jgi:nucleotide-binding universal stress UspA family protein/amino acid transporter
VLGLAFYYTAHASVSYLAAMSALMAAVAWGYVIVCRCFPDGGGVYSAARPINKLLSVVAATLLICGFIITASLSTVEAFHYFGVESQPMIVGASIGTMALLGVVNWYGAKSAGRLALWIALIALAASVIVALLSIPLLPDGIRAAKLSAPGLESPWTKWESFVRIVLALSGVEAVASMTGLMKQPVERTARKTIWPVLAEVVVLNLIFGVALSALPGRIQTSKPDYHTYEKQMGLTSSLVAPADAAAGLREKADAVAAETEAVREYRQTAVKVLAEHTSTRAFGARAGGVFTFAAGIVFGLLLLSASNTAILAMVSVFYALAQDDELPKPLKRLNYSGVPWVGLILAVAAPSAVLLFVHDDKALGELYAIGVVGAIAINMLCCALNRSLPIERWERGLLWCIAGVMSVIFATIIVTKPNASFFAGSVIAAVLATRYVVRRRAAAKAATEQAPTPHVGWLEELRSLPQTVSGTGPRVMLAARGRSHAEFAVDLARQRGATLFGLFVRNVRVFDAVPGQLSKLESDREAVETLGTTAELARKAGVQFVPIYVSSPAIVDEILDYTVTFGCDTLVMGKSKRSTVSKAVAGDVISQIARQLPEGVSLLTRGEEPTGVGA